MKNSRRVFLKTVAAAGGASGTLLAAGKKSSSTKNVLVAGPESPRVKEIVASLGIGYRVRHTPFPDAAETAIGDLLQGVEALVLLPGLGHRASLAERIDACTRSVYDVLQAAVAHEVRQVVYLSTLAMMNAYGPEFQVDEEWRPRPGDRDGLPEYLGEFVCREFAREGKLGVVVLRLGELSPSDAGQAVRRAMDAQLADAGPRLGTWSVVHIHSGGSPRFPLKRAEKLLGFRAQPGGPKP
jgi:hypothetical protein